MFRLACDQIRFSIVFGTFWISTLISICAQSQDLTNLERFRTGLDSVRVGLRIPGMAVALMRNDSLLLATGFGYADVKNRVPATENTVFRIASITKTFTSTLIMQQVEQGKLNLDTVASAFGVDLGNPKITVRNLITHTSEGEAGSFFAYNGFRYGKLMPVLDQTTGFPFYRLIMDKILIPAGMKSSAPGMTPPDAKDTPDLQQYIPYFDTAFAHLTHAYGYNDQGVMAETEFLKEFGAFGGLMSTVKDLVKYSAALDHHQFVSAKTQKEIFTRQHITSGAMTPYGLGWFVQNEFGLDFFWHYGQTRGESGLFLKIPSLDLTLVVLSNCDQLSLPFQLGDGDVLMSPVAQLLFKYLIPKTEAFAIVDYRAAIPEVSAALEGKEKNKYVPFYRHELISQATICLINGDTARAHRFYQLYGKLNAGAKRLLPSGKQIAGIRNAGTNLDTGVTFVLAHDTHLRVYGVGENCSGDNMSWCDFGWIQNSAGKVVWEMPGNLAQPAGGAVKNQLVDAIIDLPAGRYRLRYRSDAAHAYNSWDSPPPDNFFWGIMLFALTTSHNINKSNK